MNNRRDLLNRCVHHTRRSRGFTLLELLVAITVLSLLLVILLGMVEASTQLWRANENRVDAYREARAAINRIANDLSSIYASKNEKHFLTHEDSDSPKITAATPPEHMEGRLFFLTALPTDAQEDGKNKSDLCAVGYFLGYDKTSLIGKGTDSYNLYRYFRSSDDTFNALRTGKPFDGISLNTAPTDTRTEIIARNIVSFTVTPLTIDPLDSETLKEFSKSDRTPFPDIVEIHLTAISNEASKRLLTEGNWKSENNPRLKHDQRTFGIRIHLSQAGAVKTTPSPSPSPTP